MKFIEKSIFEGLFLMLDKSRFDYLPRAIYEVYDELQIRQDSIENVVVEPNIALYLPIFPIYMPQKMKLDSANDYN